MYTNDLLELGLSKNEASVYDVLLKLKSAPAGKIIKETKLHRNIVYDNLEKLISKGLVSYIIQGKRKVFQAEPPFAILEMIENKLNKVKKQEEIAKKLKKDIEKQQKSLIIQEASIYKGVPGLKTVMEITLEEGKDYLVLGAPKESVEIMPITFWENYNKKIQEKKIHVKMIFNESLREWSKKIINPMNNIKFLPKHFDSLTEFNICEDKVFIFIWSNPPLVISIQDKNLAKSYKQYFEYLWKIAKK